MLIFFNIFIFLTMSSLQEVSKYKPFPKSLLSRALLYNLSLFKLLNIFQLLNTYFYT